MSASAGNAISTSELVIGQPYGGGFFIGIIRDPVTGLEYRQISAGVELELRGKWGEYGVKIAGADSFIDGRANTEAMAAAGSDLAKQVLALGDGWAIPARDQQELQYRHLKPTTDENYCWNRDGDNPHSVPVGTLYTEHYPAQTAIEVFKSGGKEAFRPRYYWSSSQRSADFAFNLNFAVGDQSSHDKSGECFVRPVRSELIQ
ncbi:DUF1566 domain-containing protein [Pseudomonas sp. Irchel 3A18]|uniref:DUF1566 domain-containing protein n=1 Tax=Pseudomonas sp. Irchel 3A18 TaxID=2008905 RepID=UPI000BA35F65|nr:DUF1566 domain-containing protein [Pseudomonas sp. Irchel 3A18]